MSRDKMNRRTDARVFRRTATKTKAVNLNKMLMRGGIRF